MLGKALQSASASTPKVYVEDVMSTHLYTGNGSTQTITNGIDLAGEGGLVWFKQRNGTQSNVLQDTARGNTKYLMSNATDAEYSVGSNYISSFNSDGFSLGAGSLSTNGNTYGTWTFRKAEKFFDVVTYTGNGASGHVIPHNLGSTPGCVIIKRTDTSGDWYVWHRSLAATYGLKLNSTAAQAEYGIPTAVSSSNFTLEFTGGGNASGGTYVAYLFAHDAGGFGESGTESVVSCGSFTANSGNEVTVNLGWEPQWVLWKRATDVSDWTIFDNMRGMSLGGSSRLYANLSSAEAVGTFAFIKPNSTGFSTNAWGGTDTIIYLAIRRGPMKTPETGTSVFEPTTSSADKPVQTTNFPVDLGFGRDLRSGQPNYFVDRLRGGSAYLESSSTAAESVFDSSFASAFDSNTSWQFSLYAVATQKVLWGFRRAPGFFDVVAYTGTGSTQTVNHNLGVAPELMITRQRTPTGGNWWTYHSAIGATGWIALNLDNATTTSSVIWNDTAPTSTVFTVGTGSNNTSSATIIAYLFATCPGVSKVGSYTGTGTTLSVDCGFTNGARFVLIKRTDSTGDWFVWDTARGIISGDDPYLLLNSTAAEVTNTDYIDPLSSGFQISSTAPAAINANGGSFIFLAIA